MCGGYIKIKYNKTTTSIEIVGFESVFIKAHKTDSDEYKPQYPSIWRNANSDAPIQMSEYFIWTGQLASFK